MEQDELGFTLAADSSEAISAIEDLIDVIGDFSSQWVNTIREVGTNNITSVIEEQMEDVHSAFEDSGIEEFDEKQSKLENSVINANAAFEKAYNSIAIYQSKLAVTEREAEKLQNTLADLSEAQSRLSDDLSVQEEEEQALSIRMETGAYEDNADALKAAREERDALRQSIESTSARLESVASQIDYYTNKLDLNKIKQAQFISSINDSTQRLSAKGNALEIAKQKLDQYKESLDEVDDEEEDAGESASDLGEEVEEAAEKAYETSNSWTNLGEEVERASKKAYEADNAWTRLYNSIRNITFYRAVRGVIKTLFNNVRDGFKSLAVWSRQFDTKTTGIFASFNDNMSALTADLLYLRNAFAVAAEPIINALVPALDFLITKLAEALNFLSAFFSAITGKKFYDKAIKNNVDYANSLNGASKAQKNFLAGFDELEVVPSQSGGAGDAFGVSADKMFERAEISQNILDMTKPLRDALQSMADIFNKYKESIVGHIKSIATSIVTLLMYASMKIDELFAPGKPGAFALEMLVKLLDSILGLLDKITKVILTPFFIGFIDGFMQVVYWGLILVGYILKPLIDLIDDLTRSLDENAEPISAFSSSLGYLVGIGAAVLVIFKVITLPFTIFIALISSAYVLSKKVYEWFTESTANLIVIFGALAGVIIVLSLAFDGFLTPVLAVIAVIALVVIAFKALYEHCETFRVLVDGIVSWVSGAVNSVVGFIKNLFGEAETAVESGTSSINDKVGQSTDSITNAYDNGLNKVPDVFLNNAVDAIDSLTSALSSDDSLGKISSGVLGINTQMEDDFALITENSKIWGADAISAFTTDGLTANQAKLTDSLTGIDEEISLKFDELPSKSEQWGADFIDGFIKGIDSKIGEFNAKIEELANGISDYMHFSRPEKGALRDYEKWMPDFIRGLSDGIDNNSYIVENSISKMAYGMSNALNVPMAGTGAGIIAGSSDLTSSVTSQMDANSELAGVFWQGCMAVVSAIQENKTVVQIGDDDIGKASNRYNKRLSRINGNA